MESTSLTIQKFSDADFHRLALLSQTTYSGREIANEKYLDWEYIKNPDGKAIISVSDDEGKIASQYIVIPRKFSVSNKIITGSLSVNTLTHPAYRGQGLFPRLAAETFRQCTNNEVQFTIGFPNKFSLPIIRKNKIFEVAGELPLLVKPLRIWNSMIGFFSDSGNKSGSEIEINISEFSQEGNISELNFISDASLYNEFLNTFNGSRENVTCRSLDFLRWRYKEIPLRNYKLLKITDSTRIVAVAVIRAKHVYGIRCGILVDYFSLTGSESSGRILSEINAIAKRNGLDLIFTTVPSNSMEYVKVRKAGYLSIPSWLLPQKLVMIVRRHAEDCSQKVSDFRSWFITFGDYDIF